MGLALLGREVRGLGWRGWTRRCRGLFAIVVEAPGGGWERGVEAPVVVVEGRRRVCREVLVRREGSCGSGWMAPSFWRSRILKSRRLICRSSRRAALSERETFSSEMAWARSKLVRMVLQ